MSQKQNKRTTRSNKKLLIEEKVMSNCSSINKADKSPISSYSLKSSKLKGKCLTTFRKKRAIGTPKLPRREFLKSLLKSRMKIVTSKCIFVDKYIDSESILTGPNRKVFKEIDLPIHVKCAIAMGFNSKIEIK